MKWSIEKLRWVMAAGALLLLLIVVVFLGYGRYKQVKKWKETIKRLNLHGPHETREFTYSSSPKDRTSYKIHAKRVVQHGDGTWSLYDVDVTLYSKTSSDEDHIQASDIEYDQNAGVAKAVGEVHMDFEPPGALKKAKSAAPSATGDEVPNVIHVKTSGLVYVKKLDVASTDQQVEFRYQGLQCTARGAEFYSGQSLLRLLSDVVVTGDVDKEPITVHAVKAELDRNANTVTMEHPVGQSRGRTGSAAHAVVHLRQDGSVERADADGGVTMDQGTRHLAATAYAGTFGTTSLAQTAQLSGGVTMTDSDTHRPMHGSAPEVNAVFTAGGDLQEVTASGGAQMVEVLKAVGQPDMPREVRGDRIVAEYVTEASAKGHKAKAQLHEVRVSGANGSAYASAVSAADKKGGTKKTQIFADGLRAQMVATASGAAQVQQVFGNGHTKLMQTAPQSAQQVSTGDELTASFTPGRDGVMQVASATQSGHVTLHSVAATKPGATPQAPADGTGVRASYDADAAKFTLAGDVHFQQGLFDLTGASVVVNQLTGDAEATGNIVATMRPDETKQKPGASPQQSTHVMADHATLLHAAQLAEFHGAPARLWQGASEVQAATLLFDQKRKSLAARPESGGRIHAVFAQAQDAKNKHSESAIRVTSSTMDYDDVHREGTFGGGVRMDGTTMQAQSQRAVVLLEPAQGGAATASQPMQFGGQLRRVVLMESVRVSQPGRIGTGEMLVYNAAEANYTLTGTQAHPPRIVDSKQGNVTGAVLVFHDEGTGAAADSTIIVNGSDATGKQGRVREEVEVKGK